MQFARTFQKTKKQIGIFVKVKKSHGFIFLVLGKAEASAYLAVDSGSSSAFIRLEGE